VRVTGSHPDRQDEARRPARPISRCEVAWLALALLCLIAIVVLPQWHVVRFTGIWDSLPALAVIFVAFAWQANRTAAGRDRARVLTETERLLRRRRQLLREAAHELRTPITIALGHGELLAAALTGPREPDIRVVLAQLRHLQAVSDRLLAAAAADSPGYRSPEPTSPPKQLLPPARHAPAASAGSPAEGKPARVCP